MLNPLPPSLPFTLPFSLSLSPLARLIDVQTLKVEVGKDVSAYFRGEARSTDGSLNRHTQDARAMLKDLVVARLDGLLRLPEEE